MGDAVLDLGKAFDKVPHTHMVTFIQPRPGDPVQHLATDSRCRHVGKIKPSFYRVYMHCVAK